MWIGSSIEYGSTEFYLTMTTLAVFGVVGTITNALVLAAIWRSPMMRCRSNVMFIVSLAVSDIYLGVVTIPLVILTASSQTWVLGNVLCKLTSLLDNAMIIISLWGVACSAVDRYIAVAKPLLYRRHAKSKRTLIIVFVVWVIGLVTSSLPLVGFNEYVYKPGDLWCALNTTEHSFGYHGYAVLYGVVYFPIPLILATTSYIGIFCVARNLKKREVLRSKALFYLTPSVNASKAPSVNASQTPSRKTSSTESGIESDVEPNRDYKRYSSCTTNTTNANTEPESSCTTSDKGPDIPRISIHSALKFSFEDVTDDSMWPEEYDTITKIHRLSALSTGAFNNFFADTLTRSFLSSTTYLEVPYLQDLDLKSYEELFELPETVRQAKKDPTRRVSFDPLQPYLLADEEISASLQDTTRLGVAENDTSGSLRHKQKVFRSRSASYCRKTKKRSSALQIKAGVLSLTVILSFLGLHLPAFVTAVVLFTGNEPAGTNVVFWLVLLNPAFNPFIYGLLNAEIRRKAKDIITFKSAKNKRRRTSTITSARFMMDKSNFCTKLGDIFERVYSMFSRSRGNGSDEPKSAQIVKSPSILSNFSILYDEIVMEYFETNL